MPDVDGQGARRHQRGPQQGVATLAVRGDRVQGDQHRQPQLGGRLGGAVEEHRLHGGCRCDDAHHRQRRASPPGKRHGDQHEQGRIDGAWAGDAVVALEEGVDPDLVLGPAGKAERDQPVDPARRPLLHRQRSHGPTVTRSAPLVIISTIAPQS
jgi:hypothetical protein